MKAASPLAAAALFQERPGVASNEAHRAHDVDVVHRLPRPPRCCRGAGRWRWRPRRRSRPAPGRPAAQSRPSAPEPSADVHRVANGLDALGFQHRHGGVHLVQVARADRHVEAPSSAKVSAIERPIPRDAPVTTTFLPFSSRSTGFLLPPLFCSRSSTLPPDVRQAPSAQAGELLTVWTYRRIDSSPMTNPMPRASARAGEGPLARRMLGGPRPRRHSLSAARPLGPAHPSAWRAYPCKSSLRRAAGLTDGVMDAFANSILVHLISPSPWIWPTGPSPLNP